MLKPLPFGTPVFKNADDVQLAQYQSEIIDGYQSELEDGSRATIRRPGLGSPIVEIDPSALGPAGVPYGLYWWEQFSYLVTIIGNIIYVFHKPGEDIELLDSLDISGQVTIARSSRITFDTDGTYVYVANGGRIFRFRITSGAIASFSLITNGAAPTNCSHVVWTDGYVIGNRVGTSQFSYSDVNTPTTWTSTNVFNASGSADFIVALHVFNREIYLFGTQTTEIWENDGEAPFSRIPGGFIQTGCGAPYSVVNTERGIYWLSNHRQLVRYSSGGVDYVSTPYDKVIQGLTKVDDCYASHIDFKGSEFVVFTFPSEKLTLVYSASTEQWYRWGQFSSETGEYGEWPVISYAFCAAWAKHIVAYDAAPPRLFELSDENLNDNGSPIRLLQRTGHIDHGTLDRKISTKLQLRARRGVGLSSRTPRLGIRWRDDGKSVWSNERWLSLGDVGDTELALRLFANGSYRTRQYEFFATDEVPVIFLSGEEDVELAE